jgi:ribosome biogenesis protein
MASTTNGSGSSFPVVFTTKSPYPLPSQKYMIPSAWKRYHLSQLVNKALGLSQIVPFDFLVRGEVLRGSLAEWAAEKMVGEVKVFQLL